MALTRRNGARFLAMLLVVVIPVTGCTRGTSKKPVERAPSLPEGLHLRLELVKKRYRMPEQVCATVSYINNTDRPITIFSTRRSENPGFPGETYVFKKDGKELGRKTFVGIHQRPEAHTIEPRTSWRRRISDLNGTAFRGPIRTPGRYTLELAYESPTKADKEQPGHFIGRLKAPPVEVEARPYASSGDDASWGAPGGGLRVGLSPLKWEFKRHEPIRLMIHVENVGSRKWEMAKVGSPKRKMLFGNQKRKRLKGNERKAWVYVLPRAAGMPPTSTYHTAVVHVAPWAVLAKGERKTMSVRADNSIWKLHDSATKKARVLTDGLPPGKYTFTLEYCWQVEKGVTSKLRTGPETIEIRSDK